MAMDPSNAARAAGVTVMHAPITFAEGYKEISSHPYGILKGVVDGKAFVKGSWGAAIAEFAPAEGDIVIEGKRGLDTFASTNAQRLRGRDLGRGARHRAEVRLPDVLPADARGGVHQRTQLVPRPVDVRW
jgi:Isochorismatase family